MSVELLYTSAPSGLKQGSRGFCTVLSTAGMPVNLATRLETLSGYRHVFPPQDPQADQNPVCYSHLRIAMSGSRVSVLSRIAAYGVDYSGRTNKLAHHVVLNDYEQPPAGPAWVLAQPHVMRRSWDGNNQTLVAGPSVMMSNQSAAVCQAWARVSGDAGWGGHVAGSLASTTPRPLWVIFRLTQSNLLLELMQEAIALLPPAQRWNATFSTYYTNLPPEIDCRVRFVLEGTEEARLATARGDVVDLTRSSAVPIENAFVKLARSGVAAQETPVAPRATTPGAIPQAPAPNFDPVSYGIPKPPMEPALTMPTPMAIPPSPHPPRLHPRTLSPAKDYADKDSQRTKLLLAVAATICLIAIGAGAWFIQSSRAAQAQLLRDAEEARSKQAAEEEERKAQDEKLGEITRTYNDIIREIEGIEGSSMPDLPTKPKLQEINTPNLARLLKKAEEQKEKLGSETQGVDELKLVIAEIATVEKSELTLNWEKVAEDLTTQIKNLNDFEDEYIRSSLKIKELAQQRRSEIQEAVRRLDELKAQIQQLPDTMQSQSPDVATGKVRAEEIAVGIDNKSAIETFDNTQVTELRTRLKDVSQLVALRSQLQKHVDNANAAPVASIAASPSMETTPDPEGVIKLSISDKKSPWALSGGFTVEYQDVVSAKRYKIDGESGQGHEITDKNPEYLNVMGTPGLKVAVLFPSSNNQSPSVIVSFSVKSSRPESDSPLTAQERLAAFLSSAESLKDTSGKIVVWERRSDDYKAQAKSGGATGRSFNEICDEAMKVAEEAKDWKTISQDNVRRIAELRKELEQLKSTMPTTPPVSPDAKPTAIEKPAWTVRLGQLDSLVRNGKTVIEAREMFTQAVALEPVKIEFIRPAESVGVFSKGYESFVTKTLNLKLQLEVK